MFDIGFWEFALIGVITLVIVGPEKMPEIARTAGKYMGKAKKFVTNIQTDISEELEADKLKKHLNLKDKDNNIFDILGETKDSIDEIKNDADKKL